MTALLPSDRDDLQTRFLDDDVFNDPMSEYFEGPTTTSKFLPFRPPPASPIYTPTLSSRSSDAPSDAESDEIALPAFETEDIAAQDDRVFSSPSDPSTPKTTAANMTLTDGLDPFGALSRTASDDASIESEPERHVDYLSHDWREEDIWSSWRYVVSRRDRYSNGVRLENASWRTWAKSKYGLRTVSPETLNWLKDCDVTWLYGPLQTDIKTVPSSSTNDNKPPPPSELSSSNSFLDRKSILKKKTASEAILQRSLSQHTLLKHAGAILQAQKAEYSRGKPAFELATSEVGVPSDRVSSCTPSESVSSGLVSPSEKRHIHFNNEVAQCIAVEAKEWYEERDVDPSLFFLGEELDDDYAGFDEDDDTESDDGVVMMKQFNSRSPRSSSSSSLSLSTAATPHIGFRSASRSSSSSESKTIAPLPPTTLKCRSDTPEPIPPPWSQPYQNNNHGDTSPDSTKLSPTPSVETLRPSRPEANFLLDDDDEGYRNPRVDAQWRFNRNDSQRRNSSRSSSTSNDNHYSSSSSSRDRPWFVNPEDREELENGSRGNLHLTSSGMFMPYEEGESSYTGVFGRVIDTVNTARDIAHVIWNVGWRK